MKSLVSACVYLVYVSVVDSSPMIRRVFQKNLLDDVKPVGGLVTQLVPLKDLPSPPKHAIQVIHKDKDGRRHLEADCTPKQGWTEVYDGPNVAIIDEDYQEYVAKTVATIIYPPHIDRKHFEVTTQVPYLTVGTIQGIGHHPTTLKSEFPSECEKIYQDHMADNYSDESVALSEESLEVARLPMYPPQDEGAQIQATFDNIYG